MTDDDRYYSQGYADGFNWANPSYTGPVKHMADYVAGFRDGEAAYKQEIAELACMLANQEAA